MRRLGSLLAGVVLLISLCLPSYAADGITQEEVEGNAKWLPEYERFFEAKREGAIIPGLKQGLVPQSIDYIIEEDWFVISGYRDGQSSLVTIVDASTEQHVKTVQFTRTDGSIYNGHAGGIAVSDHHLWISSGEQAHYIELDKIIDAENGATLSFTGHVDIDARGSFISFSEGILWVGDFALDTRYPTQPHHHLINRDGTKHTGWIAGYELDEETDLIPESRPKNENGAYVPDYVLSIRDKIQEGSIFRDKVILTESYGRNNVSHLFVYENPMTEEPHQYVQVAGEAVPVWFLDNQNLTDTWILTPMAEAVVERNGESYIIFESAALKYLDGSYALDRLQIVDTNVLLGIEDEAVNIHSIRDIIEKGISSGDLRDPLAKQLKQGLNQAEHHLNKGKHTQATKKMQDFLRALNKKPMQDYISEELREVLVADVEKLIKEWNSNE